MCLAVIAVAPITAFWETLAYILAIATLIIVWTIFITGQIGGERGGNYEENQYRRAGLQRAGRRAGIARASLMTMHDTIVMTGVSRPPTRRQPQIPKPPASNPTKRLNVYSSTTGWVAADADEASPALSPAAMKIDASIPVMRFIDSPPIGCCEFRTIAP